MFPKVTPGTAGAFGGVTDALLSYGIPVGCCADGPSGIRMDCGTIAFSMPNGTCLACSFNLELVRELYEFEGKELRKNKVDTLLGPGINLHRHPLNGRNFEYFSEDPLLTGKMAAAQLQGMHPYGVTGTIKHFACNNQEFRRNDVEAVVSERALRELYLKGFELAVKEGGAYSVMTSYNPVNGFWSASNYDLLTTVLRGQWGYQGIVMTDWWAKSNDEGKPGGTHQHQRHGARTERPVHGGGECAAELHAGQFRRRPPQRSCFPGRIPAQCLQYLPGAAAHARAAPPARDRNRTGPPAGPKAQGWRRMVSARCTTCRQETAPSWTSP